MPNPVVLVLIPLLALFVVPVLGGFGVVVLVRGRRQRPRVLRGLAMVTAAATIAAYTWGALHLLRDESDTNNRCQAVVGPKYAGDIEAYEHSLVPLRFACRVDGVGTWEIFVPGYANLLVLALALATVLLAALSYSRLPLSR
ncbi:hypothetical protein [Kineosporia babensis]|uniref:Uncharacterized protein n=1 Tax=Kineosporia babensis TaxID=499548 RepID=A0A9X1NE43_9ACTN|nr:hypothetical protein [Kineosporia babensis]MCD5311388.1 hypothetical protein [Kineosporia babensis]